MIILWVVLVQILVTFLCSLPRDGGFRRVIFLSPARGDSSGNSTSIQNHTDSFFTINFKISLMMSGNDENSGRPTIDCCELLCKFYSCLFRWNQLLRPCQEIKAIKETDIVRWKGNAPLHSSWGNQAHGWWIFHSFWNILNHIEMLGNIWYQKIQNTPKRQELKKR